MQNSAYAAVPVDRRQLIDVRLEPVSGGRFQPTGFPDLGAAVFQRPVGEDEWQDCLLVESAQSMANRLEAVGWDPVADEPVSALLGLPWVRVTNRDGAFLTSSRLEPHRLASAYVKDATLDGSPMLKVIGDRLGLAKDTPLDQRAIAAAVMALDPLSLVHGVFFADKAWPGQPKLLRAVSSEIEAHDVREATSGGVKRDHVAHNAEEGRGAKEGYGSVPFHRQEWTAREIVARFNIDRSLLAAYGLGAEATALLENIARWEVQMLLAEPLRLRTACDLMVADDVVDQAGQALPPAGDLAVAIREGVAACVSLLGDGGPIDVVLTR